jgi:hypothetical protein
LKVVVLRHGLSVILLATLVWNGPARPALAESTAPPAVTVMEDGVQVEWTTPALTLTVGADGVTRARLAGYAELTQPGRPRVPAASTLLALPPGAEPEVVIESVDDHLQTLPAPLALSPQPEGVARDGAGRVIGGAFSPAGTLPFQPPVVELAEIGIVRGVRLARLTFYPVRPEGDALRVTMRVRVRVRFNTPALAHGQSAAPGDALVEALRASVANPSQIQSAPAAAAPRLSAPLSTSPHVIVSVNATGLTQITYSALQASGFPVGGVNPANLHLTRNGEAVAMEWDGDGNEFFEAGERLLFFAAPRFSRWTSSDGYTLRAEAAPGLRMTSRAASPIGLLPGSAWTDQVMETNALYTPDCYCAPIPPGRDGDRWTWEEMTRLDPSIFPAPRTRSYPFTLSNVDATRPATMTVWLIGYTDVITGGPDHRVSVALNAQPLGTVEWDGKQAITATLPMTAGLVQNGSNTLALSLPGIAGVAVEGVWLDGFSVRYARGLAATGSAALFTGEAITRAYTVTLASTAGLRAYDVTNENQPERLTSVVTTATSASLGDTATGHRRYALAASNGVMNPVSVRVPTPLQTITGADYLLITPITFTAALSDLITLRQGQGLTVAVENVQAIYDAYDDGRPTPDAIRAYLADAYANWTPRPAYVLLVGDGTSDPKRYRSNSFVTYLPPYLAEVDPWAGETAADNRFVTLDGNDALPDMLIGRLPVNSLTETQTVVNKIVQYETWPAVGGWNANVVFVAENADSAGDFAADSALLASAYITAPYTAQPLYFIPPTTTITATRQGLISRWNGGAGLIFYTGHSSIHQWGLDEATGQPLFHLNDVAGLWNNVRQPVVMELTCFTGAFQTPGLSVIDEALVRRAEGGAVAVWGPTGLGVATGHVKLAEGFLEGLFQYNVVEVGRLALAGKLRLALSATAPDLLDTFTLLGDPATRYNLDIIAGYPLYLPLVRR